MCARYATVSRTVTRASAGEKSAETGRAGGSSATGGSASIGGWPMRASVWLIRSSASAGRRCIRKAIDSGARHSTIGMKHSVTMPPKTNTAVQSYDRKSTAETEPPMTVPIG